MVNCDNHHWGWAYITALDIKRGAIPHSEVIIFYGYIYTLLQSIALIFFGERLMSVGIITGLFYSLTLLLSYRIFHKFLKKSLAFISVLLLFLIHPYIIYPAANYFAYTFQLLALIFFLKYSQNRFNGFLAGFFLSMAVLSRYSSAIAIIPPFVILLAWEFFVFPDIKKHIIEKIGIVSAGIVIPLIIFFIYLGMNSSIGTFFYQTQTLIKLRSGLDNVTTYLNFLSFIFLLDTSSYAFGFRGKFFSLILIICVFVLAREIIGKVSGNPIKSDYNRYNIVAVSLIAIFGFLNSVHIYETVRLVNGASLGIGVVVFVFYRLFIRAIKPVKCLIIISGILLCLFLSSSILFTKTSSAYYPWRKDVLFCNGVTNKNIGIFKGKLLTKEYNDFYQEVYDSVEPFKNSCYILNYTFDVVAIVMNDLPRIQIAPLNLPGLYDVSAQARLIDRQKAVILSYKRLDFPGYKEIFCKRWPDEIPWLGGGYLFIYAPVKYANNKQS
ncbi:MAG: glycosyltransferase family 39 protein [Syntrophaceae bacterium]|nr:glycosyltransferase family 39 protein [Syntrophaceae bacterium]